MTAYEYLRATWDEVVSLGPQGWRLVAVPPIVEVKQTALGTVQGGEPLYVMERIAPGGVAAQAAEGREYINRAYGKTLLVADGEPPASSGSLP